MSGIDEERLWQALRAEGVPTKIVKALVDRETLNVDELLSTCAASGQATAAAALGTTADQLDAFPLKVKKVLMEQGARLTAEQTRALDAAGATWSNTQRYQGVAKPPTSTGCCIILMLW